jgi:uncharacterized heparinase superfamily protein
MGIDRQASERGPEASRSRFASAAGTQLHAARDRIGLAVLAVERARRGAIARVRRSRLLRWRHRAPAADDLALAPPDLRPHDPSFPDELESGSFGLAGLTVKLREGSPFPVPAPTQAWARELHGFGWLRHLDAARTVDDEAVARRLVAEWIAGARRWPACCWAPDVVGRRVVSWLSHAGLILDGAARQPYAAVMLSLEDQATYLSTSWRNAPNGYPRLLALIGLTHAGLCIVGHERRADAAGRYLAAELERQVLADGGHVSRNPWVPVELLLDLLPLRQCFLARGLKPDAALAAAMDRMISMLHRLRLGDGQLARFNGMGATQRDVLATVMAYDSGSGARQEAPSPSGYARLERGATVLVVDAGAPPALDLAAEACAGCLSFELSIGSEMLLVNAGAPGPAHQRYRAASRATASHNTLVLDGQSSARLVRNESVPQPAGAAPIQHIGRVTCETGNVGGAAVLRASHDGYADRYDLIHTRTLVLDAAGGRLEGRDALDGARSELRFAWDVPFAVHFHLHPRAGARLAADGSAELILPSGARWRLSASGAALTIEQSTHCAELLGPVGAQQVVLRTVCYGAAEVRWKLERRDAPTGPGAPAGAAAGSPPPAAGDPA